MGDLDSRTDSGISQQTTPQEAAPGSHFETPNWMGPRVGPAPVVPAQVTPRHDDLLPEVPRPAGLREEAHWTEHTTPRLFAGAVLVSATIGVGITLFFTIATQSPAALIGLAIAAVIAIIFRGTMMSSGTATVDLKGSTLTVHRDGVTDKFNLKDPYQQIEAVGTPDSRSWRLRLTTYDGRLVELAPGGVNPAELMPMVDYYRAVAEREQENHKRRFNR